MRGNKPTCKRCNSDVDIVELRKCFKCSFCGYIIPKHGNLSLKNWLRGK